MAHEAVAHTAKVIAQQPIDNLLDTLAIGGAGCDIGPLFQGRNGIGHGNATLASVEQGMIVFSVADADGVVMGEAHFGKGREEAGSLVDAGGQNHDRAFVVNDLKFQPEFANYGENPGVLLLPSVHNDRADGEGHTMPAKSVYEYSLGRLGKQLYFRCRRAIEKRAVFRHDSLEEWELREDSLQIRELPARDQHESAAGGQEALERGQSAFGDDAHVGEGLVEIASQGEIVHTPSMITPPG